MVFDSLKGLIWEEEKGKPQENVAQPPAVQIKGGAAPSPVVITGGNPPLFMGGSSPNEEMVATLKAVIQGRRTAFTTLLETADKLANIIPDSATRLRAAYAAVSNDQRTTKEIVNAVDIHISDVNGEVSRFLSDSSNKKSKVVELKSQAQNLLDTNKNLCDKIAVLQQEVAKIQETIASNTSKAAELNDQSNNLEAKIASVQQQFEAASKFVISDLENQKSTILSTIGK